MKILLGVTGSSSAKLIVKIVNEIISRGHEVKAVVTESADKILYAEMRNEYVEYFNQKGVAIHFDVDEWDMYSRSDEDDRKILHIELAQWADKILIAPCTSNTMYKLKNGISDNLLTTTVKAFDSRKPGSLWIAPAMNTEMMYNSADAFMWFRYNILFPTTKMLTCGTFGIGALANIKDMVNLVLGDTWLNPISNDARRGIELINISGNPGTSRHHPSWFGAVRKHDIHAGVDLYCDEGSVVYACEDGVVSSVGLFTGEKVGSPWWNETIYATVIGKSGKIVYGEIKPASVLKKGGKVERGMMIGTVARVLKHEPSSHIPYHRMDMLHIELLDKDAPCEFVECWKHGEDRPKWLKDPSVYLFCR